MPPKKAKTTLRVLVVDDDSTMVADLRDACNRFNGGKLSSWPKGIPKPKDVRLELDVLTDAKKIADKLRGVPEKWDAFVIDDKFGAEHLATAILEPLNDLQVPGLRIVSTAYADEAGLDGAIRCMRLGAWDYLNKERARYSDAFTDVIVSLFQGRREAELQSQKAKIDQEGHDFVVEHYGDIYKKYKNNFVAFKPGRKPWRIVAHHPSLYGVYRMLKKDHIDRNSVHITLIQE
jgi:chemotaxis response regulator CheB